MTANTATIKNNTSAPPKTDSAGAPIATICTYKLYAKAITGSKIDFGKPLVVRTQLVKRMAAVSPATLAMPRITLVTMPGAADGMIVDVIARHFVVPNASDAS